MWFAPVTSCLPELGLNKSFVDQEFPLACLWALQDAPHTTTDEELNLWNQNPQDRDGAGNPRGCGCRCLYVPSSLSGTVSQEVRECIS